MANKAIKYRLYPTTEQSVMFTKTFGCCRKVYNLMLSDKIEEYKLFSKINTPYIGNYQNATPITYNKFKKDNAWRSSPISCVEYFKYIDEYIMRSPNGCMIPFVLDCLDKPNNLVEITNMLNILNRDKFEI